MRLIRWLVSLPRIDDDDESMFRGVACIKPVQPTTAFRNEFLINGASSSEKNIIREINNNNEAIERKTARQRFDDTYTSVSLFVVNFPTFIRLSFALAQ